MQYLQINVYWAAVFFREKYQLPLLITENGMAKLDFIVSDGKVHDPQRIEYMKMYLSMIGAQELWGF